MKSIIIKLAILFTIIGAGQSALACLVAPCPGWGAPQVYSAPINPIQRNANGEYEAPAKKYLPSKAVCRMERLEKQTGEGAKNIVQKTLNLKDGEDAEGYTNALKTADNSFNVYFNYVVAGGDETEERIYFTVGDNNDEVDSGGCKIDLHKKITGRICEENVAWNKDMTQQLFKVYCNLSYE